MPARVQQAEPAAQQQHAQLGKPIAARAARAARAAWRQGGGEQGGDQGLAAPQHRRLRERRAFAVEQRRQQPQQPVHRREVGRTSRSRGAQHVGRELPLQLLQHRGGGALGHAAPLARGSPLPEQRADAPQAHRGRHTPRLRGALPRVLAMRRRPRAVLVLVLVPLLVLVLHLVRRRRFHLTIHLLLLFGLGLAARGLRHQPAPPQQQCPTEGARERLPRRPGVLLACVLGEQGERLV